jgi:cellobiose phosphorylase
MAQGALQCILGCRPDFDGLRIDPCIPRKWRRFSMVREFRGVVYRIEVRNPRGVSKGVARLVVDGREIAGNLIPYDPSRREVRVTAFMEP